MEETLFPRIGELEAPATTLSSPDTKMKQSKSLPSRFLRYTRETGFISENRKICATFYFVIYDVIKCRNFQEFQRVSDTSYILNNQMLRSFEKWRCSIQVNLQVCNKCTILQ